MQSMTNKLLPEKLPDFGGSFDFVAFGPHPDDIEHTIGGAVIKWTDAGKRVLFCHLTDGSAGTFRIRRVTPQRSDCGC